MKIPKFRGLIWLGVVVVCGLMVAGNLPSPLKAIVPPEPGPPETSIVQRYTADYELAADGNLLVSEQLNVQFTEPRRGIFRIFDTADSQYQTIEHPVEVVSVQRRDGQRGWIDEPYTVTQSGGGTTTIRIGLATVVYSPGTQRYRIVSRTTNAITKPKDGPEAANSQWYWDVVGSGWLMPMREVRVTATIPQTVAPVDCQAAVACEVAAIDGGVRVAAQALPPETAITLQAFFADAAPAPVRSTKQILMYVGVLMASLLTALVSLYAYRRSRERPPGNTAVRFEPPGDDPLLSAWTMTEEVPSEALSVVLLELVAAGVLTYAAEDPATGKKGKPRWVRLQRTDAPVPAISGANQVLQALGLHAAGSAITLEQDSVSDGKKLGTATSGVNGDVLAHARPLFTPVGATGWAMSLSFVSVLGAGALLIWMKNSMPLAIMLLVGAAFALLLRGKDSQRLTDEGADLRDASVGFKKLLSTKAAEERFNFAARVRHFEDYLPWATAYGCADKWAKLCTAKPGTPEEQIARSQGFVGSPTSHSGLWAMSTGVAAVGASAVAAYQATQSSSSSGGGGGGGGGGSGGGGGGSW